MSLRERLLLRRLLDRDERAFREIVELHRDRVYNLTYRMLGNRAEAEDVTQEVFITVFKHIDQFRGDSKFSTWLYRVTANHCKNRIKYLSRRHDRGHDGLDDNMDDEPGGGAISVPPASPRPDRQLEGAELDRLLQEAIAELDDD